MSETVNVVIAGTPTPIVLFDSNTLKAANQATQAIASAASAALSEAYAESLTGPTYPDTATGLAAKASGDFFAVDNGDGTVSIYLDNAGVAVLQRRLLTSAAASASGGSALVGSNDGAGGSLWTTVAGFITYLRSSVGSSVVGFLQAGTGAVFRNLQARGRDTLHVADFLPLNYVTDGSVNYTTQIQAAINEAIASRRELIFPGGFYQVTGTGLNCACPNDKVLTMRGCGINGTHIINNNGNIFRVSGQLMTVTNLTLLCYGGGHAVVQTGSYSLARWSKSSITQLGDGYSVWDNAGFEYVDNSFVECYLQHTTTATVHPFNLTAAGGTINDNVWRTCRIQFSGTKQFFNVESTSANAQYANKWEDITWEVCLGGGIRLRAVSGFAISNCQNWDADIDPIINDFYDINRNANLITCTGIVEDCGRWAGKMGVGKYDLSLPDGGAGAGIRVVDCRTAGGGDPFTVNAKNNAIYVLGLIPALMSFANGGGNVGVNMADGTFNTQFGHYQVAGLKVVGVRGAAVADATDAASAITQLNAVIARLEAHGLIAT